MHVCVAPDSDQGDSVVPFRSDLPPSTRQRCEGKRSSHSCSHTHLLADVPGADVHPSPMSVSLFELIYATALVPHGRFLQFSPFQSLASLMGCEEKTRHLNLILFSRWCLQAPSCHCSR